MAYLCTAEPRLGTTALRTQGTHEANGEPWIEEKKERKKRKIECKGPH
jgi:hypothetical protein